MIEAAGLALSDILSPAFRGVLAKSLALMLVLLGGLWLGLEWLLTQFIGTSWPWFNATLEILAGVGLFVGLGFLAAPVAALVVGFFADDVAEAVERLHYPADPPGRPLPVGRSFATALKFLGLVIVVNAIALPLVLFVGFGLVVSLVANAYLLGREYFELVALRHYDEETARRLRARHSGRVFAAGLFVAVFLVIPVVNLLGPLFATALMVHLEKRVSAEERQIWGSVRP
jgi:CysZ protein